MSRQGLLKYGAMDILLPNDRDYQHWLVELKTRIRSAQVKAAMQVNAELLRLYWDLGRRILLKQLLSNWGDALFFQLSKDLMGAFPGQKGFSRTNLHYIRRWVAFYLGLPPAPQQAGQQQNIDIQHIIADAAIVPQLVAQIPWGHHREIISKCITVTQANFYLEATARHNWSRAVLVAQMESGLYERSGTAITNFSETLPAPQSDLAREVLKSPYNFEFLSMGAEILERDLENALVSQIQKLLLELGQGFAYMGRQYHLRVGQSDFFLDLLFYHTRLRAYVIVELLCGRQHNISYVL